MLCARKTYMRKICQECKDRISARVKYVVTAKCVDGKITISVGGPYEGKKYKIMVMEEVD